MDDNDNKTKIDKSVNFYYRTLAHLERRSMKSKKVSCLCGAILCYSSLSKHLKTKIHNELI